MKRKLLCIMMILALGMSILYYANLPDYLVLNSLSCSNGLNRDTTLKVVVYQYWNIDQLVSEIEEKHNKLNGTPTILTVELYPSKWSSRMDMGLFIPRRFIIIREERGYNLFRFYQLPTQTPPTPLSPPKRGFSLLIMSLSACQE